MFKVFIDGKEGTTGLRIDAYLQKRKDIEIVGIPEDKRKDTRERLKMIQSADITFLCLPDEASREIAALAPKEARILDASTAHRTLPDWVYGLPELDRTQRDKIRAAKRVAVPGCHATGFILLVRPLIAEGITENGYPFVCHSVTGYSGGGKKMISEYETPGRPVAFSSPRQYGLSQKHKHLPEMVAMTGIQHEPVFNPIVSDFYSGMVVSVPLMGRLLAHKMSLDALRSFFSEYYKKDPMIRVMEDAGPDNGFLDAMELSGQNTVQIYLYGNDQNLMLAARYDNLGKGASGGAVQCMNLMLGLKEEESLQ